MSDGSFRSPWLGPDRSDFLWKFIGGLFQPARGSFFQRRISISGFYEFPPGSSASDPKKYEPRLRICLSVKKSRRQYNFLVLLPAFYKSSSSSLTAYSAMAFTEQRSMVTNSSGFAQSLSASHRSMEPRNASV